MDLLDALSSMVRADNLPLESAFQCSVAAMRTLRGPGASLQMDDSEYIAHIYKLLPRLVSCNLKLQEKVVPAAMEALREGKKKTIFQQKKMQITYMKIVDLDISISLAFFFASILFPFGIVIVFLFYSKNTQKSKFHYF